MDVAGYHQGNVRERAEARKADREFYKKWHERKAMQDDY